MDSDDDGNGDDNNDDKEDDDDNVTMLMVMVSTRSVMLQPRSMASQTMKAAESPKTTFNDCII